MLAGGTLRTMLTRAPPVDELYERFWKICTHSKPWAPPRIRKNKSFDGNDQISKIFIKDVYV